MVELSREILQNNFQRYSPVLADALLKGAITIGVGAFFLVESGVLRMPHPFGAALLGSSICLISILSSPIFQKIFHFEMHPNRGKTLADVSSVITGVVVGTLISFLTTGLLLKETLILLAIPLLLIGAIIACVVGFLCLGRLINARG